MPVPKRPRPATETDDSAGAAAERLHEVRLSVVQGAEQGRTLVVDLPQVTVGRAAGNDLQLSDPLVSAIHLEVVPGPDGVAVRDLGSTNGTWMGPHRVRDVLLVEDAVLRLGSTTLRVSPLPTVVPVEMSGETHFGRLVGASPAIRRTFATLERLATSDLTVLLEGETGTGKEEIARAVHERSSRARQPFVVLDCAAMAEGVAEATILGHERGAFTGAEHHRMGVFRAAHGGTIFLDEIGELPLGLQPRLLRVLESRTVTPVGSNSPQAVDVRVIAATHRDLRTGVNTGTFRADLYYRLAEAHVTVPSLRERPGDVERLALHFLEVAAARTGSTAPHLRPDALARLCRHDWPGNVRELRNLVERLLLGHPRDAISADDLAEELRVDEAPSVAIDSTRPYKAAKEEALRRFDARYLADLADRCEGNLSRAAREAGLMRHHLRLLFRRAGIVTKPG